MKDQDWDTIITSKSKSLVFSEIYKYKYLIYLFFKRDFVIFYKQTILGPLWYIIQPVINTVVFTIIFGKLAKIPTDGVPPFIFYMAGSIIWGYFATCLVSTSKIFVENSSIFGKVYFPRLVVPIAMIGNSFLQFLIQFFIFFIFFIYFSIDNGDIFLNYKIIYLPFLILYCSIIGLAFGLLFSSFTAKYRDLSFVLGFGVQIWMFITPVVYPLSLIPENYKLFVLLNPMTTVVELFKSIFFNTYSISFFDFVISFIVSLIILCFGFLRFMKTERNFIDTV